MHRSRSASWLGEVDMDRAPSPAVSLGRGKMEERHQLLHRPKISGGAVPEPISFALNGDDILRASKTASEAAKAASRAASTQVNVISRLQNALFSRRLAEPSDSDNALPLATLVLQAKSPVGFMEEFMIHTDVVQEMALQLKSLSPNCLVCIDLVLSRKSPKSRPGGFIWWPISSESVGEFRGADLLMINDNNLDNMLLIIWEAMMASMAAPGYLVSHPVAIVPRIVAGLVATLARAHNLYWERIPGEEPVEPNVSATPVKEPVINVSQAPERSLLKKPRASEKRIGLKKPTSTSKVGQERRRLNINPSPEWVSTKESISSEASEEDITPPDATDSAVSSSLKSFMPDLETISRTAHMVESESEIPKHAVIAFVMEMEKAHQYFLFKERLRTCEIITHASLADDVSYELTWQNERTQEFPLVEEDDIYHAVHKYILELEDKHWKVEDVGQAKDLYAINNAIHYLLFRTREEGYMLDEKPEKELDKLRKFAPLTYSVSGH